MAAFCKLNWFKNLSDGAQGAIYYGTMGIVFCPYCTRKNRVWTYHRLEYKPKETIIDEVAET